MKRRRLRPRTCPICGEAFSRVVPLVTASGVTRVHLRGRGDSATFCADPEDPQCDGALLRGSVLFEAEDE